MAVTPLRPGDVLDIGGRRAAIIGRAARLPRYGPAFGTAGHRHALTPYGWHVQYLDTGELGTIGEQRPNRLGERPNPVSGGYADAYAVDMLPAYLPTEGTPTR